MNNITVWTYVLAMMRKTVSIAALALALSFGSQAHAACYAEYQATKKPHKYHTGVIELPNKICKKDAAIRKNISKRLKVGGWTLLNVISVFGPDGLSGLQVNERFYLKF